MNIYHVSQNHNNEYDTYSDFVVIAPDKKTAKRTYPDQSLKRVWVENKGWHHDNGVKFDAYAWVNDLKYIKVRLIGKANSEKLEVVCSSFNAG